MGKGESLGGKTNNIEVFHAFLDQPVKGSAGVSGTDSVVWESLLLGCDNASRRLRETVASPAAKVSNKVLDGVE